MPLIPTVTIPSPHAILENYFFVCYTGNRNDVPLRQRDVPKCVRTIPAQKRRPEDTLFSNLYNFPSIAVEIMDFIRAAARGIFIFTQR